ncbi:hypothetical protein EAE96_001434 [Botrytis aclada]|nr:hypothetical protein EAE96_001434 [Botrytis aclada]
MRRFYNSTSLMKGVWSGQHHRVSHLRASLLTLRSFTIDAENNSEQDCLLKYQGRIPLPPKQFESVPAGQGLLCEMLPDTPKMISRKLSVEKWDKHVDTHSGESYVTNNSEPFDRQSERIAKLELMQTTWDKERQELNMGELIRAKKFFSRISCEGNAKSWIKLSAQEESFAETRNRNAHRLDLSISMKQVTEYKHMNLGLIFEALYGIQLEELQHLLEMDKRCGGIFQVESIVGCHGTLYARQRPSRFLQPFKQWLEAVRKAKSQIQDKMGPAACQEHNATTTTTCLALVSRIDDELLQEVKRLSQICEERYKDENSQLRERTRHHKNAITKDLRERGLLSEFRVIQAGRKQGKLRQESPSVDVDADAEPHLK